MDSGRVSDSPASQPASSAARATQQHTLYVYVCLHLLADFFSRLKPSREGHRYNWEMICLGEILNWLIRLLFVLGDIENFVSYLLLQKVKLRLLKTQFTLIVQQQTSGLPVYLL